MPESVDWDPEIFKDAREAARHLPPEVRYRPLGAAAKSDHGATTVHDRSSKESSDKR